MSKQQVVAFIERVAQDDALKRRWNEAESPAARSEIARELGFEVKPEELHDGVQALATRAQAQDGELDESTLERVAGGWSWGETSFNFVKVNYSFPKVEQGFDLKFQL